MWTSKITRDELIALAQAEQLKNKTLRPLESLSDIEHLSDGLIGVWDEKPHDWTLPSIVVMPYNEKRDFFAWAASYVKVKPFTAFVRTLDFETIACVAIAPTNTEQWLGGMTGLILAETLTHVDQPATKISLRVCEGTYSFAVAKTLLHIDRTKSVRQVGLNWFRTREVLGTRTSKLTEEHLQGIWSVVTRLVSPKFAEQTVSEIVVQSCQDILNSGQIRDSNLRTLSTEFPTYNLRAMMQFTREERVKLLERVFVSLSSQKRQSEETAFLAGYLLSMIAPGTLDHWRLLDPIKQSIPTAGLWYGLCAGLLPKSQINSYGSGLARLVVRELRRPVHLLEQPTCDIAIDELDVAGPLFKSENPTSGNTIEVEIGPGVSVPVRANGIDNSKQEFRLTPTSDKSTDPTLDPTVLENLEDALDVLQEVRRSIRRSFPSLERSYAPKPKKKKSSR